MKLKEINSLLFIDMGAPAPIVLSNEHKLNLLFYYNKGASSNKGYSDMPKERNNMEDTGIAVVYFRSVLIYKFGYPNDEVLIAHSYYSLGLTSYRIFELEDSDWIDSIEKMNRIHPYHVSQKFKTLKHYIITFKDSTFECIASDVDISFKQDTMKNVLLDITSNFLLNA